MSNEQRCPKDPLSLSWNPEDIPFDEEPSDPVPPPPFKTNALTKGQPPFPNNVEFIPEISLKIQPEKHFPYVQVQSPKSKADLKMKSGPPFPNPPEFSHEISLKIQPEKRFPYVRLQPIAEIQSPAAELDRPKVLQPSVTLRDTVPVPDSKTTLQLKFMCITCGQVFPTESSLRSHARITGHAQLDKQTFSQILQNQPKFSGAVSNRTQPVQTTSQKVQNPPSQSSVPHVNSNLEQNFPRKLQNQLVSDPTIQEQSTFQKLQNQSKQSSVASTTKDLKRHFPQTPQDQPKLKIFKPDVVSGSAVQEQNTSQKIQDQPQNVTVQGQNLLETPQKTGQSDAEFPQILTTCSFCAHQSKSFDDLLVHKGSHIGAKAFICPTCGLGHPTQKDLNSHLATEICSSFNLSGELLKFLCLLCPLKFHTKKARHIHYTNDHAKYAKVAIRLSSICSICNYLPPTKVARWKHAFAHTGTGLLECPACHSKHRWRNAFKRHMQWRCPVLFPVPRAKIQKPPELYRAQYACSKCILTFGTETERSAHQITHSTLYYCELCPEALGFQGQTGLISHWSRVHPNLKLGAPKTAEIPAYKPRILRRTMTTAGSSKMATKLQKTPIPVINCKAFQKQMDCSCSLCPQTFKTYMDLLIHERAHGDAVICDLCGGPKTVGFKTLKDLDNHCRIMHPNVTIKALEPTVRANPPFQPAKKIPPKHKCLQCGQTFHEKYSLTRHENSHGEGHPCKKCPASFKTRPALLGHLAHVEKNPNTLHKDDPLIAPVLQKVEEPGGIEPKSLKKTATVSKIIKYPRGPGILDWQKDQAPDGSVPAAVKNSNFETAKNCEYRVKSEIQSQPDPVPNIENVQIKIICPFCPQTQMFDSLPIFNGHLKDVHQHVEATHFVALTPPCTELPLNAQNSEYFDNLDGTTVKSEPSADFTEMDANPYSDDIMAGHYEQGEIEIKIENYSNDEDPLKEDYNFIPQDPLYGGDNIKVEEDIFQDTGDTISTSEIEFKNEY